MLRQPFSSALTTAPLLSGIGATLFCAIVWAMLHGKPPRPFQLIDARVNDFFFQLRGPIDSSGLVVIVDIDEESLQRYGQWPWPRDIFARLVTKVAAHKPKIIGITTMFPEKDRTSPDYFLEKYSVQLARAGLKQKINRKRDTLFPDNDALLGKAMNEAQAVQGFNLIFRNDTLENTSPDPNHDLNISTRFPRPGAAADFLKRSPAIPPTGDFFRARQAQTNLPIIAGGSSMGFLNILPDTDGSTRRVPVLLQMNGRLWPSLVLEMYQQMNRSSSIYVQLTGKQQQNGTFAIESLLLNNRLFPTDRNGRLGLNPYGSFKTFLYIPACNLLDDDPVYGLSEACVLIGSTAAGHRTSTPFSQDLPVVELQANILDNLIQHNTLNINHRYQFYQTLLLIIIAGIFITVVIISLSPAIAVILCLLTMAAVLGGSWLLFVDSLIPFSLSYALCSLLLVFLTVFFSCYLVEGRRRAFIRKAFSQYVSPSVIHELMKNPDRLQRHEGKREVSILFCDIRGFSALAESIQPEELNRFLNAYFSLFTEIITTHRGTVDKYIGDAIMAVWGSPLDDKEHAVHAVCAALEMQRALTRNKAQLLDRNIAVGIGINSGTVSAGNFGSDQRFDYTVFGDNVNLASRVEKLTKQYPEPLLITDRTRKLLPESFACRYVATVQVRGRIGDVGLYAPVGEIAE